MISGGSSAKALEERLIAQAMSYQSEMDSIFGRLLWR